MRLISGWIAALLFAWLLAVPFSPASAGIRITVDKAGQKMNVEVDGVTYWVWPVSTGRRSYETPAGSFKAFRMEEDHYSKEWDEAPMPHSIFFTSDGHAIHGSYETRRLGRRASHGCVRLAPQNAAKLFALVRQHGLSNTRVVVLEDPNAPIMAKRETPKKANKPGQPAGYDPALTYAPAPLGTPPAGDHAFGYIRQTPMALPPRAGMPTATAPEAVQYAPMSDRY